MRGPRPRIGVTGPRRGGGAAWLAAAWGVWAAGGWPVRITPGRATPAALDGLIIGGGADVSPALYDGLQQGLEKRLSRRAHRRAQVLLFPLLFVLRQLFARPSEGPDKARDLLEGGLIAQALARGTPLLGICRGAQLINVALGGSLHPDLAAFYEEVPQLHTILPLRTVLVEPGSRLAGIVGARRMLVNALHHQAVAKLGRGLAVVARDLGGVTQAVEHGGPGFVVGVQWHPEYLPWQLRQRRVFGALVEAARGHASRRG